MSLPKKNSNYPELKKPSFHDNTIPPHLLHDVDEHTKYVLQQLSLISQQNEWLIDSAIDTNEQVRHTNGRVTELEKIGDEQVQFKKSLNDFDIFGKLRIIGYISNYWAVTIGIIIVLSDFIGVVTTIYKVFHP